MSVALTAGGRRTPAPAPTRERTDADWMAEWEQAITRLLETAVAYGRAAALVRKRQEWCAEHWDHPKIAERQQATYEADLARNALCEPMLKQAAAVSWVQRSCPHAMFDFLEAFMGHPLYPGIDSVWAMTAARLQTTDLFWIAHDTLIALGDREDAERVARDARQRQRGQAI